MDIGDTGEDCNLWTTITVMRGKACCKKCFVETEIQWRSWEGETVRLAKGGGVGDEGAASRAAKLLI